MANFFAKTPKNYPQPIPEPLTDSIDVLNELIRYNAKRPESMQLLEKMLKKRSSLQWVNHPGQNSLSG